MEKKAWKSMTPQEQRDQMNQELDEVVKILRAHGRQHILLVLDEVEGKHDIRSSVDVNDDHHYMDLLCAATEAWWKAQHPATP